MLVNLYIYVIVIVAYIIYNHIKDLPFHYITQTNFSLCEKMNSTFCIRISYFVMAIVLYLLTIKFINLTLPQDAPKVVNAITNDKPSFFGFGSLIGAGISVLSYIFNIILGFSSFNGMMMTSFSEELIYRGLLIGVTKQFLNTNICVFLSALVFGYVHVKCSLKYGMVAFITGIVLGYGYLHYGLYWCIGLHALFNFVETSLHTITNIKVINKLMGGERVTPDDDGMMTPLIEIIVFLSLYYFGYF